MNAKTLINRSFFLDHGPRHFYEKYFGLVEDPSNWKLPTRELRTKNELEAHSVARAVEFFTGAKPILTVSGDGLEWTVHPSPGYYNTVGT